MKWSLSPCRHKAISGRYEVGALKSRWRATWNPIRTPGETYGLSAGGRVYLGIHATLEQAKRACELHAQGAA